MSHRDPASEGRCRSCGQTVLWVEMFPSGKNTCLNPVPVLNGNIERKPGQINGAKWYGRVVPKVERKGRLYVSHFANCPQADQWRKRET